MKKGLRELSELLDMLFDLSLTIAKELKDGFQLSDILSVINKIFGDKEFRDKLTKAVDGASGIPAEIKKMGVDESIGLAMKVLPYVPKIADAFSDEQD